MKRSPFEALSPAEQYVVLALAAEELVTDHSVVFTFFGPPAFKVRAKAWVKQGLEAVLGELGRLEGSSLVEIDDAPPFFRRTYLRSQIRALRALLEIGEIKLSGAPLADAVVRVLGLSPPPPYDLEKIRPQEREVFTRHGYTSYADFQKRRDPLPTPPITDALLRKWIRELEDCFVRDLAPFMLHGAEFVKAIGRSRVKIAAPEEGHPPDSYVYHGGWRGTMCLGHDFRQTRLTAMRTIMHELCPGHHMYYLYRDLLYRLGLLGVEATVDLIYSSETPLSEGVAETGLYYLRTLEPTLLGQVQVAAAHEHFSKKVLYNVWHGIYIAETMSREDARAYLVHDGGFENEKVDTWLAFIDGWRIYYPAYPVGTGRIQSQLTGDPARDLLHLYLPKSLPVLDALEEWRRGIGSITSPAAAAPEAFLAEKGGAL